MTDPVHVPGGGKAVEVITMDPRDVLLLAKNAQYMRPEKYRQLVKNVKRDGFLSSTPYTWADPDRGDDGLEHPECLSGNHRVRAAIEAELAEIVLIRDRRKLSVSQRRAIQISHNSLVGEHDPATLAELYEEIRDVELRAYAGLDDKDLDRIKNVKVPTLAEVELDRAAMTFLFLPHDAERIKDALDVLQQQGESVAARWPDMARFTQALGEVSGAVNITDRAIALAILLDVHEAQLGKLAELYDRETDDRDRVRWVPLSMIFGSRDVPPSLANLLLQVVERMRDEGDVTDVAPWKALEYLAAEYLAGVEFADLPTTEEPNDG